MEYTFDQRLKSHQRTISPQNIKNNSINITILDQTAHPNVNFQQHSFALIDRIVEVIDKSANSLGLCSQQQLDLMDLYVQNQLLHRQFISKIAFNACHNLLAVIADAADTVTFFHYQPSQNIFNQIFQSSSRPSGKKSCLSWSPNGLYLSLGSANLELWKLDEHKLAPAKNYNDDFIDIKIIAWSPDSTSVAFGGLSKKNAIKVRSLQSGNLGEIPFDLSISAISYDPFGKYLLILARNNILYVYNCTSLTKLKEVPLSPEAQTLKNISTVKQTRIMSWSPDFNYLVCPSIDDSKVSLAFALARSQNFKIANAFFGHASSISCASFSPILYQWEEEPCSILALGDSHGAISIWRISSKISSSPLLLSNSETSSSEVVEQLEWSSTGDILFANMMKRYINILIFKKSCFGREISIQEKSSIIQSNFGAVSAAQIHKKQIEIFSFNSKSNMQASSQNSSQLTEPHAAKTDLYSFSLPKPRFGDKVQYVRINEQVTIKDKNNRKKIQPAMLVRKQQVQKKKEIQENTNSLLPATTTYIPIQYKSLNLKLLSGEIQVGRLQTNKYLELKKIQNYSILQLLEFKDGQFMVVNERTFVGNLQYVKIVEKLVYVYNKGSLFILDCELNMQELPICLGELHRLSVNTYGDVYFLNVQGFIRGFNHIKRVCYTPASIPIHSLLRYPAAMQIEEKKDSEGLYSKIIDLFSAQSDHNLYVTITESDERYFFDRFSGCWVSLQLNKGLLKVGHSLRVTELEEKLIDDFFRKINGKIAAQQPKGQTSIQQYQNNLIYYKKHNPNQELYKQNILGLVRQLKIKGLSEKLRTTLNKYFVNESTQFYVRDETLRQRIRTLGGNVIQEFIHFQKI